MTAVRSPLRFLLRPAETPTGRKRLSKLNAPTRMDYVVVYGRRHVLGNGSRGCCSM